MFFKIVGFVSSVGRLIGAHIFSPDYKTMSPALLIIFFDLITYLMISVQNIYMFREDFVRVVFCTVTLGMGFQGAIKLYTFIVRRPGILKLAELVERFYEHSTTDRIIDEIFQSWNLIFCHASILGMIIFYGCTILTFLFPVVYYLIFHERILHFGFIIPGSDSETYFGYSLNFAHQTLQMYLVINALYVSTSYALYFMLNAFAQYDVLHYQVSHLTKLIIGNKNNKNNRNIKKCLSRITEEHVRLLK